MMFTLFMSCVYSENCANFVRNLGAWSPQFRNEIWGGSLRNSGTGQPASRFLPSLCPLHDCARAGRGLSVARTAWRWGSSTATPTAVTAPWARPPRSRRASFHGRRQVGPTGQNAVLGVRRHLSTRAGWILGRTRAFHVVSDQAGHKYWARVGWPKCRFLKI